MANPLLEGLQAGTELGKSLYTGNAVADFVRGLTQRAQQLDLLRAKTDYETQGEIQKTIATAPIEAKAKKDAETAAIEAQMKAFGITPGGTSEMQTSGTPLENIQRKIPSGVSLSMGPFTVKQPTVPSVIQAKQLQLKSQSGNLDVGLKLANQAAQEIGGSQGFGGRFRTFKAELSGGVSSPALRQYIAWRDSNVAGFYTMITGDPRPSDTDISRARDFFWRPEIGEPWSPIGKQKMNRVQQLIQQNQQAMGETPITESDEPSTDEIIQTLQQRGVKF